MVSPSQQCAEYRKEPKGSKTYHTRAKKGNGGSLKNFHKINYNLTNELGDNLNKTSKSSSILSDHLILSIEL